MNKRGKQKVRREKDSFSLTIPRNKFSTGLKYLDIGINSGGGDLVNSTAGVNLIPSCVIIPTGTTQTTRVGKRVFITKVDYMFGLTMGYVADTAISNSTVRITAVRDDATQGNTAAYNVVYSSADLNSHYNVTNLSRFKFLLDKQVNLNSQLVYNVATTKTMRSPVSMQLVGSFNVNDYVEYGVADTTGAVGQTARGSVNFYAIGDNTAVTFISIDSSARVWFYDAN